jgi:hypothetical protein
MRPSYFQVEQAKRMLPITLILTKQQGYPANIFVNYFAIKGKKARRIDKAVTIDMGRAVNLYLLSFSQWAYPYSIQLHVIAKQLNNEFVPGVLQANQVFSPKMDQW